MCEICHSYHLHPPLFLCVCLSDEISGHHFLTATKDKMESGHSKARAAKGEFPALPRALLCLSISLAANGRRVFVHIPHALPRPHPTAHYTQNTNITEAGTWFCSLLSIQHLEHLTAHFLIGTRHLLRGYMLTYF